RPAGCGTGCHQGREVIFSLIKNRTAQRGRSGFFVSMHKSLRCGHEGPQNPCHLRDRHGLEIDMARSGDNGVEDPLTAEHHVLEPRDRLDIHGAGGIHGRQISGIHHQGLTGIQVVFHDMPVELGEGNPPAGELLHDEALAAEEAGAQLLLEKDGQLDARLAGQEAAL
ncbi:putative acetyltransferase involved in intracellular survival and related acetyltransferases, partial [Dysosmobacter welbionis]